MTTMDLTKHTGLIKHMAIKAAYSCGITHEFEDVLQEAWVAACEALRRYNPDKAALSTYIGNAVFFRVIRYYGNREPLDSLPEWYDAAAPVVPPAAWELWLSELTPRQREMVDYSFQPTAGRKTQIIAHFAKLWGWAAAKATAMKLQQKLLEVPV